MKKTLKHWFFPLMGFFSLVWFLVRVIPKPKRATYPCMRVAGSLASSFLVYVAGLFSSVVFFKKAKAFWKESKYLGFAVFGGLALFLGLSTYLHTDTQLIWRDPIYPCDKSLESILEEWYGFMILMPQMKNAKTPSEITGTRTTIPIRMW